MRALPPAPIPFARLSWLHGAAAFLALVIFNSAAAGIAAPEWPADAVFYQIYPERFRNGDPANDPTAEEVEQKPGWRPSPWTSDWYELQSWELSRNSFYNAVNNRRYGGDLQGVIEKLDYLTNFGISAIYLNPIFEAFSHHKYDGSTYHHVDNNFGPDARGDLERMRDEDFTATSWDWTAADKLFLKLIQEAHKRRIRVIIDGVFNHVGTRFPPFQDVVKNQQKSKYADWFIVRKWDDPATPRNEFDYKGWWNLKSLPEFQEDDNGLVSGPRQYVFAITRRWMDPNGDGDPSDGIDGWRLDVAPDVAHSFWREWRKLVKSINTNAFLVGEIWDDAASWLQGDEFDSVMNYRFAKAAVRFFVDTGSPRLTVSGFDGELAAIRNSYPERINYLLLNLYDSHDTDRIASMIKNPNRQYDRDANARDHPKYDVTKPSAAEREVQRLMAIFQMTYLGAPMIYYGTEAGMWGADDPDDRKPMLWADLEYPPEAADPHRRPRKPDSQKFDGTLFTWYQRLIAIRNQEPALRRGTFQTLIADDQKQIYAFNRSHREESIIVVINKDAHDQSVSLEADRPFRDLLNDTIYKPSGSRITFELKPLTGAILKKMPGH